MSEFIHEAPAYVLYSRVQIPVSQDDGLTKLRPCKSRKMEELARQNFDLVQQVHTLRELLTASGHSEASESAACADKTKPEDQKTNVPTGTATAAAAGAAAAAATTATAGTTTAGGPAAAAAAGQSATSSMMPPSEPSSSSTRRRPFQAGTFPSANDNVGKYKRQNVSPETRKQLDRRNAKTARRRERSKNQG